MCNEALVNQLNQGLDLELIEVPLYRALTSGTLNLLPHFYILKQK